MTQIFMRDRDMLCYGDDVALCKHQAQLFISSLACRSFCLHQFFIYVKKVLCILLENLPSTMNIIKTISSRIGRNEFKIKLHVDACRLPTLIENS